MTKTALRIACWLLVAAIAFATVLPIGFRPITMLPPNVERALAFAMAGFLFHLAYPRSGLAVVAALIIALELAQLGTPGRHGTVPDAVIKLAGAALGAGGAALVGFLARRRS